MKSKFEQDIKIVISDIDVLAAKSRLFGTHSHYVVGLKNASLYSRYYSSRVIRPERNAYIVSNISSKKMGSGFLTELLTHLKEKCKADGISLEFENVLNERLEQFLIRNDFVAMPGTIPTCYQWNGSSE